MPTKVIGSKKAIAKTILKMLPIVDTKAERLAIANVEKSINKFYIEFEDEDIDTSIDVDNDHVEITINTDANPDNYAKDDCPEDIYITTSFEFSSHDDPCCCGAKILGDFIFLCDGDLPEEKAKEFLVPLLEHSIRIAVNNIAEPKIITHQRKRTIVNRQVSFVAVSGDIESQIFIEAAMNTGLFKKVSTFRNPGSLNELEFYILKDLAAK